jgi:hypothetical protein
LGSLWKGKLLDFRLVKTFFENIKAFRSYDQFNTTTSKNGSKWVRPLVALYSIFFLSFFRTHLAPVEVCEIFTCRKRKYTMRWHTCAAHYYVYWSGSSSRHFLRFLSNIFKKQSRNLCFTPLLFCMNHNDLPTE